MRGDAALLRVAWSEGSLPRNTQHAARNALLRSITESPLALVVHRGWTVVGAGDSPAKFTVMPGILQQGLGQRFGHSLAVGGSAMRLASLRLDRNPPSMSSAGRFCPFKTPGTARDGRRDPRGR